MSDEQLFFVVLLLLYMAEGIHLIPQKSIVFRSHFGSSFRWKFPANIIGSTDGGILFSNPLPPFGSYFVVSPWAVSLSPHGVLSHTLPASEATSQRDGNHRLHRLDDIDTICTDSESVLLNGITSVKCTSDSAARDLADLLRTLASLSFAERETCLEDSIERQFDTTEIRSKHEKFKNETLFLRMISHLQFVFMFVVFPIWTFYYGFAHVILPFLAGIMAISVLLSPVFYMTHLSLFGSENSGILKKTVAVALYPPAGIRSVDYLSLRYFSGLNMVAVSSVLCGNAEFQKLAIKTLRELRHPVRAQSANLQGEAGEIESWWRSKHDEALTRFMEKEGVSTDLMSQESLHADESSVSFCPRCLCEYTLPEGFCPDCENVELLPITRDNRAT